MKVKKMCKKMMITNNNVNLCDSCKYTYPDCSADEDDILFGDGVGKDNICCCNSYQAKLPDNTVSKGVYEQVVWERDVTIEQLKELGYGFGEKIRYDDDAVNRKEVLRMINCINEHNAITPYKSVGAITEHLMRIAKGLSTVTPKAPVGRWEDISPEYHTGMGIVYRCSACKKYCTTSPREMHYCPNCGAKMEGI